MRQDLLFSLLCSAVLFAGCSAALDFDSTTKGQAANNPDVPDGSSFSCAKVLPAPTFCDDFEEDKAIDANWSITDVTPKGAGEVSKDDSDAASGDHALLAVLNSGMYSADDYVAVIARRTFADYGGMKMHLFVSFDMKVEKFDHTKDARITPFQFLFGCEEDPYNQLVLSVASTGEKLSMVFRENQGMGDTSKSGPAYDVHNDLSLTKWSRVTLDFDIVDPNGTGNSGEIQVNGVTIFKNKLSLPLHGGTPCAEFGEPWLDTSIPNNQEWRVLFDNVLVNVTPKS